MFVIGTSYAYEWKITFLTFQIKGQMVKCLLYFYFDVPTQ